MAFPFYDHLATFLGCQGANASPSADGVLRELLLER